MSLEATEKGETWRHRAGDHGKMEADPGATYLRRMLRISRSRQEPGEGHGADCPSGSPRRSRPCRGLGVRLLARRTERAQSCCFKPPRSQPSVMTAPGASHRRTAAQWQSQDAPGAPAPEPVSWPLAALDGQPLPLSPRTCAGQGAPDFGDAGVTQSCRRRRLAGPAPTEGGLTSALCRTGP